MPIIKNHRLPLTPLQCPITICVGTGTFPRIRGLGMVDWIVSANGFRAVITKSNYTAVHLTPDILWVKELPDEHSRLWAKGYVNKNIKNFKQESSITID